MPYRTSCCNCHVFNLNIFRINLFVAVCESKGGTAQAQLRTAVDAAEPMGRGQGVRGEAQEKVSMEGSAVGLGILQGSLSEEGRPSVGVVRAGHDAAVQGYGGEGRRRVKVRGRVGDPHMLVGEAGPGCGLGGGDI